MNCCDILIFFSISIITSTTTITKCFFSFFQTLSKVVLYEKSQNTAMQNICCEQRTKKIVNKKNSLKYKVKNYNTIFLPDVEPALRAIERKHFHFSFFFTFFAPRVFLLNRIFKNGKLFEIDENEVLDISVTKIWALPSWTPSITALKNNLFTKINACRNGRWLDGQIFFYNNILLSKVGYHFI